MIRAKLDRHLAAYTAAVASMETDQRRLIESDDELQLAEDAHAVLKATALKMQSSTYGVLAGIVSRCLKHVMGDAYSFEIRLVEHKTKSSVEFIVLEDEIAYPINNAKGGGVKDIVAFGLRFAALQIVKQKPRSFLLLDEPFRCLSKGYRPKMRRLLEALSDEFECQFIIVTHDDEFCIGKVVDFGEL